MIYMKKIRGLWVILVAIFLIAADTNDKPNYYNEKSWAALPFIKDGADQVPSKSSFKDNQNQAEIDVFYIHPTTFYRTYQKNADIKDRALNRFTDKFPIKSQATVFNGTAKVYAPRYRQAALHNFFRKNLKQSEAAFEMAYEDIRTAFEYYLKYYNQGRPIVIAGHSQGSMHGKRLLKEFFDTSPLKNRLVAAYLIGHPIMESDFMTIPVCNNKHQTGCVVSYNTFGWDSRSKIKDYSKAICVNPLSWKTDEQFVKKEKHLGAISQSFEKIDTALIGCKCNEGVLWITKPLKKEYDHLAGKNYHIYDYNLFYANIRQNIEDRLKAFFKQ